MLRRMRRKLVGSGCWRVWGWTWPLWMGCYRAWGRIAAMSMRCLTTREPLLAARMRSDMLRILGII